ERVGPRMLRITDIQAEAVNWESVPYCRIDDARATKYRLARGDLVFARTGATTGKSYLLEEDPPDAVFASYLIRVRLHSEVNSAYVYAFFRSLLYWQQIADASRGTGQPNVNGTRLAQLWVPVPGPGEQELIARRVKSLLIAIDEIKRRLDDADVKI